MTGGRVDKDLTAGLLEAGEFAFGMVESDRLGLPPMSGPLQVRIDGEVVTAHWNARTRRLGGEDFRDILQLSGAEGDIARFEATVELLTLTLVRPASRFMRYQTFAAPVRAADVDMKSSRARPRAPRLDDRLRVRGRDEFDWISPGVGVWKESLRRLRQGIVDRGWDAPADVELRLRGESLAAVSGFEELLALGLVKIDHMPHQEAAALRVLRDLMGRAVLADEVGLGKTIEAGLIMKELIVRGLVRRVLIVCPAPLRDQWRTELSEKFEEDFRVVWGGSDGFHGDRLIMSLQLATRNDDELLREPWDLVVIDEAHKIAGANARASRAFAERATGLGGGARYVLFLSATPVQNDLLELYRIVQVLRPGTFSSQRDFQRRYISTVDRRRPVDAEQLRRLCSEVMVRTTRAQAGLDNVRRYPRDVKVPLSETERRVYELCVSTLRGLMTRSGDHLRRLQLAKRLVASPRALSDTALRMAAGAGDDHRLREALSELGHLAGEMRTTARQEVLAGLAAEWITDPGKGKVLVFTGQTATLEDIMRVLDEAGIESVPFHGQMGASARNISIARFRGDVPVMVSTDSGAEGLNLQFANCVVNYDLPWNPMRIEQRIGRVHRVTQTRDVHVANMYAEGTIDERVYSILRDKLAMFELLFGQITTILGEVSDSATSFEATVMNALLERSDEAMNRRLDAYGEQLADAKERADRLTETAGAATWLGDLSYRDTISPGGAGELMPAKVTASNARRDELAEFVTDLLERAGGTVLERDADYLHVVLPEVLRAQMQRDQLHLAFTPGARERHADAELCAVGSEVFEELISMIAEHGDLSARIVRAPEPGAAPWVEHTDEVTLVSREVLGPAEWGARATWRVRTDGPDGGTSLMTTQFGRIGPRSRSRSLAQDEPLPETLPGAEAIVSAVTDAARPALEAMAAELSERLRQRHETEVLRVVSSLNSQIDDDPADRHQLRTLRDRYLRSMPPAGEVQADLLAIEISTHPRFRVRERWARHDGTQAAVEVEWDPKGGSPVYVAADGSPIRQLAVCSEGHVHDAAMVWHCTCCGSDLCPSCGQRADVARCEVCGEPTCGGCMARRPKRRAIAVCKPCAQPIRTPERDTKYRRAWALRGGLTLLCGERSAEFVSPTGETRHVMRGKTVTGARRRVMAAALAQGLPADTGVAFIPAPPGPVDRVLDATREEQVVWRVEHRGETGVDARAVALLTDAPPIPLSAANEAERDVIDHVADIEPPVPPPTIVAYQRCELTSVVLESHGLTRRRSVRTALASDADVIIETAPFTVAANSGPWAALTVLGPVTAVAERLHDGYRIAVSAPERDLVAFVRSPSGRTEAEEQALHDLAVRSGLPAETVVRIGDAPKPLGNPPTPTAAALAHRTATVALAPVPAEQSRDVTRDDLIAAGVPLGPDLEQEDIADPEDLWLTLRALDGPRPEITHEFVHRVTEGWTGDGCAIRRFETNGVRDLSPWLPDLAARGDDFGICSEGHFHVPGASDRCPVCLNHHCEACGDPARLGGCPECGRTACGRCRPPEAAGRAWTACAVCGEGTCDGCGRDTPTALCGFCGRPTCGACTAQGLCSDCRGLADSTIIDPARLPQVLAAPGVQARALVRGDACWVLLEGAGRREIAFLNAGHIVRWLRFDDRSDDDAALQMALVRAGEIPGDRRIRWADEVAPGDHARAGELPLTEFSTTGLSWGARSACFPGEVSRSSIRRWLVRMVGAEGPLPAPAQGELAHTISGIWGRAADRYQLITVTRQLVTVSATAQGLVLHDGCGLTAEAAWTALDTKPESTGWSPPPDGLAAARLSRVHVEALSLGALVMLRVTTQDGRIEYLRLAGDEDAVARAMLAQAVGLPTATPLAVADAVDLGSIGWPTLNGPWTLARRTHSRALRTYSGGDQPTALEAVRAEFTTTPPCVPPARSPKGGSGIALALLGRRPSVPASGAGVWLDVQEVWHRHDGQRATVRYALAPGQHVALLTADDDGRRIATATLDRDGHVTGTPVICPYCDSPTCSVCMDPVSDCRLCGNPVCGRCATSQEPSLHLCPACGSLRKAGFLSRRLGGLKGKPLLKGEDRLHHVQAAREDDRWHWCVSTADGAASPRPASGGVELYLDRLADR